jgi:N-acetylmuramoyl-L-alanine amidase
VENGFMSNRLEGRKLLQPAYQKKIAGALATAIRGFFGNRPDGR